VRGERVVGEKTGGPEVSTAIEVSAFPEPLNEAEQQSLAPMAAFDTFTDTVCGEEPKLLCQVKEFGCFDRRGVCDIEVIPKPLRGTKRIALRDIELHRKSRPL
jgi:hypothetical protein